MCSTQETLETGQDSFRKRADDEDYAKFSDEARKSMTALRLVIVSAKSIVKAPDSINDGN